jgi:glycine hydroxymethyltransferase
VGDLIADVLESTTPDGDSKVRYRLDPGVAERVRARAADLVGAHPLYPEVSLDLAGR